MKTKKFKWTPRKKTGKSIHEIITDNIVKGLEKEGLNWVRPWSTKHGMSPDIPAISYDSKKIYTGINYWLMQIAMWTNNFNTPEFITYKKIKEIGGTLNEDAEGFPVIYSLCSYFYKDKWYPNEKSLPSGVNKKTKGVNAVWSQRYYTVYNLSQTEGIDYLPQEIKDEAVKDTIFEPITDAESVYANMPKKPTLKHGGTGAFYKVNSHHIQMPNKENFTDKTGRSDDYYKTLFHEMIHSTGHESILNRESLMKATVNSPSKKKQEYAKEELVAELGSLFLCGVLGLEPKDDMTNSQAYINGWITHLKKKDNEKEVFFASQQSQKAVEFILNK